VFVEKPLALTLEEVDEIETALAASPDPKPLLMVGFNRRFSPAAVKVRDFFAAITEPLTVSVRFNAGPIPQDHWTQDDKVGGGRIIGEACHGIDLATVLTGSPPVRVYTESIGGVSAPEVTDDQCFITLRHANGSISQVHTSPERQGLPKERVEVFGGGRVAIIDDFRELTFCAGGKLKHHKSRTQDKGHAAEIERFALSLTKGESVPIPWNELRSVTMAAILAVRSIREGVPFDVP
jgi:predicted dehydrogenase